MANAWDIWVGGVGGVESKIDHTQVLILMRLQCELDQILVLENMHLTF